MEQILWHAKTTWLDLSNDALNVFIAHFWRFLRPRELVPVKRNYGVEMCIMVRLEKIVSKKYSRTSDTCKKFWILKTNSYNFWRFLGIFFFWGVRNFCHTRSEPPFFHVLRQNTSFEKNKFLEVMGILFGGVMNPYMEKWHFLLQK